MKNIINIILLLFSLEGLAQEVTLKADIARWYFRQAVKVDAYKERSRLDSTEIAALYIKEQNWLKVIEGERSEKENLRKDIEAYLLLNKEERERGDFYQEEMNKLIKKRWVERGILIIVVLVAIFT